jgi:hypothetical protein
MAPVLVGDFLNLTGMACYVAGLQFLCWGLLLDADFVEQLCETGLGA